MTDRLDTIKLIPGRYVLAVSGGVDSMTLLDLLAHRPGVELVVAHFDHGIRAESSNDGELVSRVAERLGLVLELGRGNLGASASEDRARQARYGFLEEVRAKHDAQTILTAHHQDDLVETAVINILRGSGRRGLSAIKDNPKVLRPMLDVPKADIVTYAKAHNLSWLEDSTNWDPKYLRNYVRLQILPKLKPVDRSKLIANIDKVAKNKIELDNLIATLSHTILENENISRSKFAVLPTQLADELITFWLREQGVNQFDRKLVERLSLGLKTALPGAKLDVANGLCLEITRDKAHFSNR